MMLLITSGEYVETELFAEFGRIPPAFLPVGNKRLYTYQIDQFGHLYDQVCLTLPDDFMLDEADAIYFDNNAIRIHRTRAGIPLGAAVRDFLEQTKASGRLDILYGDTLITDQWQDSSDWLAVGQSDDYYDWHHEAPRNGQPGGTWTGMFSFSNAALLRDQLDAEGDFIAAVGIYNDCIGQMAHKVVGKWLDFGHIHTYFDSKREITTQRHFNELTIADGVLTKSSSDTKKILAEADWFERAPPSIKPFLPGFITRKDTTPAGYLLEYLHLAALNELYVFGRLPQHVWKKIFSACDTYLRAASRVPVPVPLRDDFSEVTYLQKTLARLATFSGQTGVDLDAPWVCNGKETPSLRAITLEVAQAVIDSPCTASFIHGDFCFSNILFDFRSGRIKIVDPRGLDALGNPTPYGDLRYDIGKLAHSVLGLYDFIIAGFFLLTVDRQRIAFKVLADRCAPVQKMFGATSFAGRTPIQWDCYPTMLLLFLSMLPLHVDNERRQQALMANCLRLYLEWKHDHHTDGRIEQPLL